MEEAEIKHVLEAALLAAGRPLTVDKLLQLFAQKGPDVDRGLIRSSLAALSNDYEGRGLQIKEVASGYRIQINGAMTDWLQPLWDERPPRYTRALLETLALIAYRQPVTRGEIEEVRGVAVSVNIVRTLLERGWIRVVGHRDVPGKPEMFGTTREFLDYFGLKSLDDLPTLAEIKDGMPELGPQTDLIEGLATSNVGDVSADNEPVSTGERAVGLNENADGETAEPRRDIDTEHTGDSNERVTPATGNAIEDGPDQTSERAGRA